MAAAEKPGTWHPFMFEDSFEVKSIDNSRFERAGRIAAESITFENLLDCDINNMIWPVKAGDIIYMAITDNVSPADNPRDLRTGFDHDERLLGKSVMDEFEYVMFGKVYKKDEKNRSAAQLYASFGGLLMRLTTDAALLKIEKKLDTMD
mmetsp:Transcript_145865/g.257308  ORF Transcript_145865/g.257308 Transcript_145865/m.257308 type:complete len:149 (-) Transcript_145865:83-529(-)